MTPEHEARMQAWKDGLSDPEVEFVERIEGMSPSMAIAFVAVALRREIDELRRPLWRQALAPVTAFGAVVAALLSPDVPRP